MGANDSRPEMVGKIFGFDVPQYAGKRLLPI